MANSAAVGKSQKWLISPATDFFVFLAAPLIIVPMLFALPLVLSWEAIKIAVLSVSATGHHLPGYIRAYTDTTIFNRFRARLILVPPLFLAMAIAAAWYRLNFLLLILVLWGAWHGGMQTLGFLRIYDLKNGLHSKAMAKLDFWVTLTWLIQIILWSVPKKTSILSYYYLAGGPLIPVSAARAFEGFWFALTVIVTVSWLALTLYQSIAHRYFNYPKFICLISSMGFWAYCMIAVDSILLGVVLWEIFHDLQYNVFVWGYNRNRVVNDLSQSKFERFLFQKDLKKVAIYASCIVAYGCIGIFNQDIFHIYDHQHTYASVLSQIGSVFTASALFHFYLDGFIWKVRDAKVQRDLGFGKLNSFSGHSEVRHWVLLGLLVAISAYLGISEYKFRTVPGFDVDKNLTELIPNGGYVHFIKAEKLRERGDIGNAIGHLQKAIDLDTSFSFARGQLGSLKLSVGDYAGAINEFEALAESEMDNEYRSLASEAYFQIAYQLLNAKRASDAKSYLQKTLTLNPNRAEAWNYLGMTEHATGDIAEARTAYLKALELDSSYTMAKENLKQWEKEYLNTK